ncbi:MAG TPA: ATP-binding protein [Roseiflexaceae bacterium]|nr:ATP-binding protein [Roseiflexaceae bacterium]
MLTSITADALVRYLSWGFFVLLGLVTSLQAIRRPTRASVGIALLFGASTLVIAISVLRSSGLLPPNPALTALAATALLALPYLLLRLMDDVIGVAAIIHHIVLAVVSASVLVVWVWPAGRPAWLDGLLLLGVVAVLGYVVLAGVQATRRARGVTRRRLAAVTLGSLFLALTLVTGNLHRWLPISPDDARSLASLCGLATGVCYYLGFAPPRWLRRAWQEPELRAFLERAAQLPRLQDTANVVRALERGAAASLGASGAYIGLWDAELQVLRFPTHGAPFDVPLTSDLPAARAFRAQQPLFSPHTRYDPALDALFRLSQIANAVLASPITAGARRLGVLTVTAPRAPIFAGDDLALVQLLADQAAVILESRRLLDEAARVRAREEAARLKEDFLSAAAHNLKTPLTTIIAQAQLIDRRLERTPERPVDRPSIQRIVRESERLRDMVRDLLDATRAEQGRLLGHREPVDVALVAREVAQRHTTPRHPCLVEVNGPVVGLYDRLRIAQLLENLVENAVKYSPEGGPITLAIWRDAGGVHITVSDRGIGIPSADLPHLFERFHRGTNVDDRRFPGMGLGLYICRGIVEEHGGYIVAESRPDGGTTFHVTLPGTLVAEERAGVAYSGR